MSAAHDTTAATSHAAYYARPSAIARLVLRASDMLCVECSRSTPAVRFDDDDHARPLCRAHYGCEECAATTAGGATVVYRECEQRDVCSECWGPDEPEDRDERDSDDEPPLFVLRQPLYSPDDYERS